LDSPAALYWELIAGDEHGEIVGVICPDCLTVARAAHDPRRDGARVVTPEARAAF